LAGVETRDDVSRFGQNREVAMPAKLDGPSAGGEPPSGTLSSPTKRRVRFAGLLLRTVFILILATIAGRVSLPQSGSFWKAFETPGDMLRLVFGLLICIAIVWQAFRFPEDAEGSRTWLYLGLAGVPFALICLAVIW
jgi:uncharacterized membrane protein YcjF (UPF0283 family)